MGYLRDSTFEEVARKFFPDPELREGRAEELFEQWLIDQRFGPPETRQSYQAIVYLVKKRTDHLVNIETVRRWCIRKGIGV